MTATDDSILQVVTPQLQLQLMDGDMSAVLECQALAGFAPQNPSPPSLSSMSMSLEYTSAQLESAKTILELFSKQVRAYMADHVEWMECMCAATLSVCLTPADVHLSGTI